MAAPYRLYGAELSPYSVKVRSYLAFKNADFQWLPRSNARQEEFARYAKLPLIPLVVDANERVLQDSTPIIETLETELGGQSIAPSDPAVAFLAMLIEDYADEWLNKPMFHYRWSYPADQESAAQRIVAAIFEGEAAPEGTVDNVRTRMIGRLHYVGSSPQTAPLIEASFTRALAILEPMLAKRPYVLGARPSLADFGLAGQLGQLASDPTPGAVIRAQAPHVAAWLARMEKPRVEGDFASLAELAGDLRALLQREIAGAYLPWMAANAAAVAANAAGLSVEIDGVAFAQKPQRYAAKAFAELLRKRAQIADPALAALLAETGVEPFLSNPSVAAAAIGEDAEEDEAEGGDEDDASGAE
jgi:glutathione S-transferase